jgi:hypothetical protein
MPWQKAWFIGPFFNDRRWGGARFVRQYGGREKNC